MGEGQPVSHWIPSLSGHVESAFRVSNFFPKYLVYSTYFSSLKIRPNKPTTVREERPSTRIMAFFAKSRIMTGINWGHAKRCEQCPIKPFCFIIVKLRYVLCIEILIFDIEYRIVKYNKN